MRERRFFFGNSLVFVLFPTNLVIRLIVRFAAVCASWTLTADGAASQQRRVLRTPNPSQRKRLSVGHVCDCQVSYERVRVV